MQMKILTGIAALLLATGTAHAIESTYEVYCYFGRQMEITQQKRNQDFGALIACTYDQESCQRVVNRPYRFKRKWLKPNPPFECAPGKLTLEMPD
jgi:hypothetical protein